MIMCRATKAQCASVAFLINAQLTNAAVMCCDDVTVAQECFSHLVESMPRRVMYLSNNLGGTER